MRTIRTIGKSCAPNVDAWSLVFRKEPGCDAITRGTIVTFRQCGRAAVIAIVLLSLAVMTLGHEAPALESGRPALGAGLGPAPRGLVGFKNLDPNFRRASNWTRTRLAVLGLFSLIGSPRHFEALPAGMPDTAALRANHQ